MADDVIARREFLLGAGTAAAAGIASAAPARAQSAPGGRPADLVLRNGKVITVDAQFAIVEAIAISGDRILAVGPDAAMAPHIVPGTRVFDLAGRTVIPGLIDGHAHMDREGTQGRLSGARTGALDR